MAVCFAINFGAASTSAADLGVGLALPWMKGYMLTQAVGTIGAVVMPHNLYLHSGLVKSRAVDRMRPGDVRDAVRYNLIESAIALACSFLINLCVVGTFADFFYDGRCAPASLACVPSSSTGGGHGDACASRLFEDAVCAEIGLAAAAPALAKALGEFGRIMWGVGLLAAGQASTMTATFAGQFVMSGYLRLDWAPWKRVLVTRLAALGPAIAVAVGTADAPGTQNAINEYLNVLQSLMLPFAMLPLLVLTSDVAVMGRFTNGGTAGAVAAAAAVAVLAINVVLVVQFVLDQFAAPAAYAAAAVLGVAYFYFVLLTVPKVRARLCGRPAKDARDPGTLRDALLPSAD